MSKIEPESQNHGIRLTAIRGEKGGGDSLKESEVISQRTYMKDPWTWTMVWELTKGDGLGGEESRGEN